MIIRNKFTVRRMNLNAQQPVPVTPKHTGEFQMEIKNLTDAATLYIGPTAAEATTDKGYPVDEVVSFAGLNGVIYITSDIAATIAILEY